MVQYNITFFRSRGGPASTEPENAPIRLERTKWKGEGPKTPLASLGCSGALHAALLGALILLTSNRSLLMVEDPRPVSLLFEAPPAVPPTVVPEPDPAPVPAPPAPEPPPPPAPQLAIPQPQPPPDPAPRPTPEPEADLASTPLPLPPPPVPPPPPEPTRRLSGSRAAPVARSALPTPAVPMSAPATPKLNQSPSPSAAAGPPLQAAIIPSWQGELASWLNTHKTYPMEARRRGEQGRATVRFTVSRDGQVQDVLLLSSTGSVMLDEAIEHMLHGAHVPPFPSAMEQTTVTVTVQIRYALE